MNLFLLLRQTFFFILAASFITMAQSSDNDVKNFVNDYMNNLNSNNSAAISDVLHSDGTYYGFNDITQKSVKNSAEEYIELIKTGRLGGWKGTTKVNHISVNTNIASAGIQISTGRLKQTQYLTLMKTDGDWKVINVAYSLSKEN